MIIRRSVLGLISIALVGALQTRAGLAIPPHVEASRLYDHFTPGAGLGAEPLFSFHYDGRAFSAVLEGWDVRASSRELDAQRLERTLTYTDPATKLEVRAVAVIYRDFPTVEWTVYFKNNGAADTPILSEIQALDATIFRAAPAAGLRLHHAAGTLLPPAPGDFEPLEQTLGKGETARFIPQLGRPTGALMPYFNLERGDGTGVILALGWPGAWAVGLARDAAGAVRLTAGQEITHLKLHPGEEIRTPLVVLQFWRGDWIGAQNTWRRWMIAHNIPRPGGRPPGPWLAASTSEAVFEMTRRDEASQFRMIDRYEQEKFPLNIWWIDAGWYENNGRWQEPKAFRPDRARFPRGLRSVSDYAHARDMKTIVWFEPERVMPTNELFKAHPEWLLRNPTPGLVSRLLYLGNPEARAWLTDMIDRRLTEEGIDIYRQDFCIIEPSAIWRLNDAPDRQGITENHHLTGYLAFWDELKRRHPDLIIDSCAGGGSRNDLETLRRALPFWRSDHAFDVESNQGQTYGLALWWPCYGTATGPTQFSPYELRSNLTSPLAIVAWDMQDPKLPLDDLRRAVSEWQDYAPNYAGDFYPLTPWSLAKDQWLAWQFDRPELGRGVIQAFRRDASAESTLRVKLRGLDPAGVYRFTELGSKAAPTELSGREAMDGFMLNLPGKPAAANVVYERVPAK